MEPMREPSNNQKRVRSVEEYLSYLKLAKKSDVTIRDYRAILGYYADFIEVPISDLHKNLLPDDLMRYAESLDGKAAVTRTKFIRTVARFMKINHIVFDVLELGVITSKSDDGDKGDEPLTRETAQQMIDLSDPQMKAVITFMCSTGCRAGETAKLLLSDIGRIEQGKFICDIKGSVVNIRNDIAKNRKGGLVFLTSESREYLSLWLNARNEYIRMADIKSQNLRKGSTGRVKGAKHNGAKIGRPTNDTRVFACSYYTLSEKFKDLYSVVGNKKDIFGRGAVVPHRCRAFFRTNAARTMGTDLAEGILRHTGYLNKEYFRMTPEERERAFREGEAALYITRADHRIQSGKLSELERENQRLQQQITELQRVQEASATMDKITADREDLIKEILKRVHQK